MPFGEPRHFRQVHLPAEPDDRLWMRFRDRPGGGFELGIVEPLCNVGERRSFHGQRDRPDHIACRIELLPDARNPAQFGEILPGQLAIEVDPQYRGRPLLQPLFPRLQRMLAPYRTPVDERAREFRRGGNGARGGIAVDMRQQQHGQHEGRQKQHQRLQAALLAPPRISAKHRLPSHAFWQRRLRAFVPLRSRLRP